MQMLQLGRLGFMKIRMTIAIFIFEINFLRAPKNESRIHLLSLSFKKR